MLGNYSGDSKSMEGKCASESLQSFIEEKFLNIIKVWVMDRNTTISNIFKQKKELMELDVQIGHDPSHFIKNYKKGINKLFGTSKNQKDNIRVLINWMEHSRKVTNKLRCDDKTKTTNI